MGWIRTFHKTATVLAAFSAFVSGGEYRFPTLMICGAVFFLLLRDSEKEQ